LAWAASCSVSRRRCMTHGRVVRQRRCVFAFAMTSSPATAPPHRSNRPALALRATRHDRPDPRRRCGDRIHAIRHTRLASDRAPLLRFGPLQHIPAHAALSRGSRPRDDPALTFRPPAHACCANLTRRALALAVLRLNGSDVASLESADARGGSCDRCCAAPISPWRRRLKDRLDVTPVVSDRPRGCCAVKPLRTLANDPPCRALPHLLAPSDPGHAPTRPLARCSATRCSDFAWPGRNEGIFPLPRPAALMGLLPFAGFLPRTGGRAAPISPWKRRLNN